MLTKKTDNKTTRPPEQAKPIEGTLDGRRVTNEIAKPAGNPFIAAIAAAVATNRGESYYGGPTLSCCAWCCEDDDYY